MISETRLDLAYISPLNPMPNGLSDYSEALVQALSEFAQITLYSDCGTPSNPIIAEQFQVRPIHQLLQYRAQHDLRLYQIGNSPDHRVAFDHLRWLPGVVTLHEPFLHHGLLAISPLRYRREVFYECGPVGKDAVERLAALTVEDDRTRLMAAPLIGRLVDSSLGIVVHSHTARQMIEEYCSLQSSVQRRSVQVAVIPHLMPVPGTCDVLESRVEFDLSKVELIFGVMGTVHPTKEPHLVLQAFARVAATLPHARLVFVGDMREDYGVPVLARDLGIADRVTFLGRVDPIGRMHRAMAACDVIVNLRRPTIGETSGSALRAMALGRPVIVRNVGWYGELPDTVCSKIGSDAGVDALASAMLTLSASPEACRRLGDGARRYVQSECDPSAVARRYAEFLWTVYERACAPLMG